MLEFHGFDTVCVERVGDKCFLLGRHQVAKDIYAVWEKGESFRLNAFICDDECKALAELQRRVGEANARLFERVSKGTFPTAAGGGCKEEKGVAAVAERTTNPICRS